MAQKIQLPYTLQTHVGMVLQRGLPANRYSLHDPDQSYAVLPFSPIVFLPCIDWAGDDNPSKQATISSCGDYLAEDWFSSVHAPIAKVAIACIRRKNVPNRNRIVGGAEAVCRFLHNVDACRDATVDADHLVKLMKSRTRLDLEQAAAMVVSAFVNASRLDDAEVLLRELTGVLATAGMSVPPLWWQHPKQRQSHAQHTMDALAGCSDRVYSWCKRTGGYDETVLGPSRPRSYAELVRLLLRFRRVRPRHRCLYIPAWLFRAAEIDPPAHHAGYLNGYQAVLASRGQSYKGIMGYQWPEMDPEEDSIVLSKHLFRLVQRQVYRLYRFWDPTEQLRRDVRSLEDTVLYAAEWVGQRLRETDDVARVACWFFAYQRQLQQRVVSNYRATGFLAPGEGNTLYQNNLRMRSTFEEALIGVAGLEESDRLGVGAGDTAELMDRTCLLMKRYVDVYGHGKKENLVFKRGNEGGSGRGPVDEYNVLCDILNELKIRSNDQGIEKVPGPAYKFLAKDIMHWNKSWGDDAFAGGKVHGWEDWLKERGLDERQDDRLVTPGHVVFSRLSVN